jgi:hypothetical protein
MERTSAASTQANDSDNDTELIPSELWADQSDGLCEFIDDEEPELILIDDEEPELILSDDEEPELILIDDEEPATPLRTLFVPVCVAFVPVIQQPVQKQSSRSARRRRQRAMNRWFRHNMQDAAEGEQQEGALDDDLDAEFSDELQLPESDAESPEIDAAESWPIRNSSLAVSHDKKKTDLLK